MLCVNITVVVIIVVVITIIVSHISKFVNH